MSEENIYKRIQDALGNIEGHFSILEEQIPVEIQMEYFELSKNIRKDIDIEAVMNNKNWLFLNEISIEDKKNLLAQLAGIDKVEAFRTIEKYTKSSDQELKYWGILALRESRILIESSLLDESQVFISTGLGGKGLKLRYFIVFISKDNTSLNPTQIKIINNECDFVFKKHDCEIEEIKFNENFASITSLIPLQIEINSLIKEIINECNQFGNFLHDNAIITNVKYLSNKEITDLIKKHAE